MVWKSSGFQPSYTLTVRLYNPDPGSRESTHKFITGPLAAIMLLGIPISTDTITFSWPFIHRIFSPGIYDLDPAFISNITVIKGGDQQQISYKQRLGIVDVRIDFGSLFSTMLATKGNPSNRPTLKKYLEGISGQDSYKKGVRNFSLYEESSSTEIDKTKSNKKPKKDEEPTPEEAERTLSSLIPGLDTAKGLLTQAADGLQSLSEGISNIGDTIPNPFLRSIVKAVSLKVSTHVSGIGTNIRNIGNITDSIDNFDILDPRGPMAQLTDIKNELTTSTDSLTDITTELKLDEDSLKTMGTQMAKDAAKDQAEEYLKELSRQIEVGAYVMQQERENTEKANLQLQIETGKIEKIMPGTKQYTKNRINTAIKAKSRSLEAMSPKIANLKEFI